MIVLSPQAQRLLATTQSFASIPAFAAAIGLQVGALTNADFAELAAILTAAGFKPRLVDFVQVWVRGAVAPPQALSR
jgi:hypothetical protein